MTFALGGVLAARSKAVGVSPGSNVSAKPTSSREKSRRGMSEACVCEIVASRGLLRAKNSVGVDVCSTLLSFGKSLQRLSSVWPLVTTEQVSLVW